MATLRNFFLALIFLSNTMFSFAQNDPGITKLNFKQTINFINKKLAVWCEYKNPVTVTARLDGYITITNKNKQTIYFNLKNLEHSEYDELDKEGVSIEVCNGRLHVPLSWINFNNSKAGGFIRLQCNTPKKELEFLQDAFIHLKLLCKK